MRLGQRGIFHIARPMLRRMLSMMGDPPIQIVFPDGETIGTDSNPVARLLIREPGILPRLLRNPELHFGDAYSMGHVEVEGDLVRFLLAAYRGIEIFNAGHPFRYRIMQWLARPRSNSMKRARDNIHYHYDIGNDFYRLWLDKEMIYTCAYFHNPQYTLEEAQRAKMEHICRKLRLKSGETVVEAGCGWGALAMYMARCYGVKVKAFNISREQISFARERAVKEGLGDRVEFICDDYRNISGRFDAFVSVGMLEHVGKTHYEDLGEVVNRCLKDDGRGLLHFIGRNRPFPMNPWMERRIFPGAYPPTLREMMNVLEPWNFSVLDVENLRLHYAKTLEHWLERFEGASNRAREMFGESFVRAWRLYLAGSIASFLTGSEQLFQVLFARPSVNDIPWTRAHLYAEDPIKSLKQPVSADS